ncbi:MAG TPA: cellulose binding domain-containing protein [Streptosporangiaceae bacterium]
MPDSLDPAGRPVARRTRWVSRIPLLPVVAGVGALGVVLAAYGTQQISLNFSDGDAAQHGGQTDGARAPLEQAGAPAQREGAAAQGVRAGRGVGRAGGVTVAFRVTSQWADGFQGSATIVNVSGRPISGWTFAFRVPNAQVLSIWEVQVVRLGGLAIVRNPAQSPSIAPGDSVRIGFTARGAAGTPSACAFNRVRCHII